MRTDVCLQCRKRRELCGCAELQPQTTRTSVLILQHPQEQHEDLGTARISTLVLHGSVLRTGLSWPNLGKAWGQPAISREWGVLYLGSGERSSPSPLQIGPASYRDKHPGSVLRGIVCLDGTWSQAKSLWWRNPWLLKLHRYVLRPKAPSRYGSIRREPRPDCLSTIESLALALDQLGEGPEVKRALEAAFTNFLDRWKTRPV